MSDATDPDKVTDQSPNRVTDETSLPPEDDIDFHRKTSDVGDLIKLHEVVVRGGGFVRCPCCRSLLEFCVWGYSGLGPSFLQCQHCEEVCLSHRRDWADMAGSERFQYLWLSFCYMLFAAVLGFLCTTLAYDFAFMHSPIEHIAGTAAIFWAVFVAGVQIYRILRSLTRTWRDSRQPGRPNWWNPDFGLQWKLLILEGAASIMLALLVRVFRL